MKKILILVLTTLMITSCAKQGGNSSENAIMAEKVKKEFLHAWNAYKKNAWGQDALKPLSKSYHNWYKKSLVMTPVDAFDTMILMGLNKEAEEAKQLILERLSFDKALDVQGFEINIRLLGGLISCYQWDGDKRFLDLAEDIGNRLLPLFESPTGLPYRYVHLQTGETRDHKNNPAEIGTYLLEFGTLSKLTNNPVYYDKAKKAVMELYKRRSKIGFVGTVIDVNTGEWDNELTHISGMIDSYYESVLKAWLLFDDEDCKEIWDVHIEAINKYLADEVESGFWYGSADMNTGERKYTRFGALDAFFPAVLALAGDLERAVKLEDSAFKMWNLHGIEPEQIDYKKMEVVYQNLLHYTKDEKYRKMGETFYNSLVQYCRVDEGYAALKDVRTKEKDDSMESFYLAETLKYLYLIFAPEALDFEKVIFNTEAHPIKRTW